MKALILAAAVAVACTGLASAKEVKVVKTALASKAMTDKDMDNVTAGSGANVYGAGTTDMSICLPGQAQAYSPSPNDSASARVPTFH